VEEVMGKLVDKAIDAPERTAPIRCPICAHQNEGTNHCRHVRWTFDQGDPLDFARFALETSPYSQARGHKAGDIPKRWWMEHGEWVVDCVLLHFDAADGLVFGELSDVDLLARDILRRFSPEPERAHLQRVDPV
jgi:hypothetical protein